MDYYNIKTLVEVEDINERYIILGDLTEGPDYII